MKFRTWLPTCSPAGISKTSRFVEAMNRSRNYLSLTTDGHRLTPIESKLFSRKLANLIRSRLMTPNADHTNRSDPARGNRRNYHQEGSRTWTGLANRPASRMQDHGGLDTC